MSRAPRARRLRAGSGYARAAMTQDPAIEQAVRRAVLAVALRNGARSVVLLLLAAGYVAWLA